MNWTLFDYLAASVLLCLIAIGLFVIFRKFRSLLPRLALSMLVIIAVGLLWVQGAVGIF